MWNAIPEDSSASDSLVIIVSHLPGDSTFCRLLVMRTSGGGHHNSVKQIIILKNKAIFMHFSCDIKRSKA